MNKCSGKTFEDVYSSFVLAKTAKGVSDTTIRNYHQNLHNVSLHFDITMPFEELSKSKLEEMVVSMRAAGLAHNSIATYVRSVRTFLNWCNREGLTTVNVPNIKERETVKETYTDEELALLLKKPDKGCDFCEYRGWVIVCFLMNSGCRAATVRNIQNRDVDLASKQITLRHTKNGKIQVIPLCSQMVSILLDYMEIRGGDDTDYLFCNQYGEMLTENALRLAIVKYNRGRGVQKTSIHLFRHTFARKYLVDCGGNAFTLQRLMGHSTLKMTKHYCAIFDADIAKSYDNFSPLAKLSQSPQKISKKRN
ncbi:MAG: site-specific integrase [Ruminiclostridium sp.]|nr:site-specific integrase [Ruminiclostridium sp.]